jgi:GNAT superfamily N-acetyltransferase
VSNGSFVIEPARRSDRQSIRDICVATCWMGEDRPEALLDEGIWAEYWTRWFTDRQWQHTWIVRGSVSGRVVGYLTGTPDERRFHEYVPWLVPLFLAQLLRRRLQGRPVNHAALRTALRSMWRGETRIPHALMKRYPATWHVDLLPEACGRGLGSMLLKLFLERMRDLGVSGLHAQPMSINPAIICLLQRHGFRLVLRKPLTAFEHFTDEAIDVQTWVRSL